MGKTFSELLVYYISQQPEIAKKLATYFLHDNANELYLIDIIKNFYIRTETWPNRLKSWPFFMLKLIYKQAWHPLGEDYDLQASYPSVKRYMNEHFPKDRSIGHRCFLRLSPALCWDVSRTFEIRAKRMSLLRTSALTAWTRTWSPTLNVRRLLFPTSRLPGSSTM